MNDLGKKNEGGIVGTYDDNVMIFIVFSHLLGNRQRRKQNEIEDVVNNESLMQRSAGASRELSLPRAHHLTQKRQPAHSHPPSPYAPRGAKSPPCSVVAPTRTHATPKNQNQAHAQGATYSAARAARSRPPRAQRRGIPLDACWSRVRAPLGP
jgi:hypothetical protein